MRFSSCQTQKKSCSKLEFQPCYASLYFGKSLESLRQWRSTLSSLRVTGVISLRSCCTIRIRVSLWRFGIVKRTKNVKGYVFFLIERWVEFFSEMVEWNWVGGPNGKYLGQGHGGRTEWSVSVTKFYDKWLLSSATIHLLFLDISITKTSVNDPILKLKLSE